MLHRGSPNPLENALLYSFLRRQPFHIQGTFDRWHSLLLAIRNNLACQWNPIADKKRPSDHLHCSMSHPTKGFEEALVYSSGGMRPWRMCNMRTRWEYRDPCPRTATTEWFLLVNSRSTMGDWELWIAGYGATGRRKGHEAEILGGVLGFADVGIRSRGFRGSRGIGVHV